MKISDYFHTITCIFTMEDGTVKTEETLINRGIPNTPIGAISSSFDVSLDGKSILYFCSGNLNEVRFRWELDVDYFVYRSFFLKKLSGATGEEKLMSVVGAVKRLISIGNYPPQLKESLLIGFLDFVDSSMGTVDVKVREDKEITY